VTATRRCVALALALGLGAWSAAARADSTTPDSTPGRAHAEARALLDRWVAAQNRGDFDAYRALYAPRFVGVRRSGERTVRFDLDGWLRDRKRMFDRGMTVAVDDVFATQVARATRLTFRQSFTSAAYRDVGHKQLTVERVGGDLFITAEEMLDSQKLGAPLDAASVAIVRALHPDFDAATRTTSGRAVNDVVHERAGGRVFAVVTTAPRAAEVAVLDEPRVVARRAIDPPGDDLRVQPEFVRVAEREWAFAVSSRRGSDTRVLVFRVREPTSGGATIDPVIEFVDAQPASCGAAVHHRLIPRARDGGLEHDLILEETREPSGCDDPPPELGPSTTQRAFRFTDGKWEPRRLALDRR
jgi:hypothetical protein